MRVLECLGSESEIGRNRRENAREASAEVAPTFMG